MAGPPPSSESSAESLNQSLNSEIHHGIQQPTNDLVTRGQNVGRRREERHATVGILGFSVLKVRGSIPRSSTRQGPHDSNDHAALGVFSVFSPAFRVLPTAKRALFDDGSARGRHVDLMLVSYQRRVAEQLVDDRRLEFQLGRITPDDDIFAGTQLGGDGILRFRAHLGDDGAHRVGQTTEDGQCLLDGAAVQAVVHR